LKTLKLMFWGFFVLILFEMRCLYIIYNKNLDHYYTGETKNIE